MARFNNGIMGGFTGIVGNIEDYIRKGQPVMRARRRKVTKPSDAQKACRQRMKVVNEFTRMITDYVRIGFELDAAPTTKTANNLAKSYQLLHGLKGEYPNLEIDYPKVRVTSGTLEVVQNPTMVLEGSALNFSWENDKIRDNNFEDDQLMILVYYPDRKIGTRRYTGAKRGALKDTIKAYKLKPGERLEAYLSFRADDRKSISNSVYVGCIWGEAVKEALIEKVEEEIPKSKSDTARAIEVLEQGLPHVKIETELTIESGTRLTFKSKLIEAIERTVEARLKPAIESIPAATFKSKLIAAIERTVEARSKPAIESIPAATFKSKLIAAIERTVEARSKPTLPAVQDQTSKTAAVLEPETAIKSEPDLVDVIEQPLVIKQLLLNETAAKLGLEVESKMFFKPDSLNTVLKKLGVKNNEVPKSKLTNKKKSLPINSRIRAMQRRSITERLEF
jgi:hypothetical protein